MVAAAACFAVILCWQPCFVFPANTGVPFGQQEGKFVSDCESERGVCCCVQATTLCVSPQPAMCSPALLFWSTRVFARRGMP